MIASPRPRGACPFHGQTLSRWGAVGMIVLCCSFGRAEAMPKDQYVALLKQGAAALHAGAAARAEALFTQAISVRPKDPRGYYQRGVARAAARKLVQAEQDYRRAIARDARFAVARNNLGALLLDRGAFKDAIVELKEAVLYKQQYAEAWFNLGLALSGMGHHGEAAKAYRRAARLRPRDIDLRINLGGALQRTNDLNGAVAQLQLAVRLAPRNARARCGLGELLAAKGQIKEAESQLRQATGLDPAYVRGWEQLGLFLARQRQFGPAVDLLKGAIGRHPKTGRRELGRLYLALGRVLHKGRQYDRAVKAYGRAATLVPKRAVVWLLTGLSHAAARHCKAASRAFARFKELGGKSGVSAKALVACRR